MLHLLEIKHSMAKIQRKPWNEDNIDFLKLDLPTILPILKVSSNLDTSL